MISIVTYGRNDNYSFNLVKRTAFSFNCLAEVLTDEDEILFVDYNTPDHLPTLPEFVWDTLTEKALRLVKVIRISHAIHEQIKRDSPLQVLENVSRNAAIVRSNPDNHWILSTNPDVLLVLAGKWANLDELLRTLPDSFYEMPRFDIPESVWSSLNRLDPKNNMRMLRDWLISNRAAVPETSPDWQYQRYILFDAPGDFQLAPRDYFFRLHGFDESMNRYLHSDSNLCKRMWLLNGCRTDHLMGHLWVLHQDHYLSGEWAKTYTANPHNDLATKVDRVQDVIANGDNWGLASERLPVFSLGQRVAKQQNRFFTFPESIENAADLPLTREPDWRFEPVHRLFHYDPEIVTLYLREILQVVPPSGNVAYIGRNSRTLERIRHIWKEVSPNGTAVCDLSEREEEAGPVTPDVLLVDCFHSRSEYWQKRVSLMKEQAERRVNKGRISETAGAEQSSSFADQSDFQSWLDGLFPLWEKVLPSIRLRHGALVILLGCNVYVPPFHELKKKLTMTCHTAKSTVGSKAAKQNGSLERPQELLPLYVHHRVIVLRSSHG